MMLVVYIAFGIVAGYGLLFCIGMFLSWLIHKPKDQISSNDKYYKIACLNSTIKKKGG